MYNSRRYLTRCTALLTALVYTNLEANNSLGCLVNNILGVWGFVFGLGLCYHYSKCCLILGPPIWRTKALNSMYSRLVVHALTLEVLCIGRFECPIALKVVH